MSTFLRNVCQLYLGIKAYKNILAEISANGGVGAPAQNVGFFRKNNNVTMFKNEGIHNTHTKIIL